MIDAATQRALEQITARSQDVQQAFTPGAMPNFGDVAAEPSSRVVLDPLSVAPPSDAYFVATDARGRTVYTRDGSFHVMDGMLVDAAGTPVLGFSAPGAALGELRIDPVDAALGRSLGMRIEQDGTLAYDRAVIDPRNGTREMERVTAGRVALARFPAASKVIAADAGQVMAPPGVVPHLGRAGDGNFAPLEPMRQTASRIDFDASLDRLEEAYVSFDALQAAHKAQGSLSKTAMDLLK